MSNDNDTTAMPRCRLFLVTPPRGDPDTLARILAAALEHGDVASLLIRSTGEDGTLAAIAEALMPIAFQHDVAVLLDDVPELAAEIGADGVQIPGELERYREARRILGADRIVGAACDGSRHLAMELGEAGADYVALDQDAVRPEGESGPGEPIIAWWSALVEVPCVAFTPAAPERVPALIAEGADFIRPADEMWLSAERARETIRRMSALIAEGAPA